MRRASRGSRFRVQQLLEVVADSWLLQAEQFLEVADAYGLATRDQQSVEDLHPMPYCNALKTCSTVGLGIGKRRISSGTQH